MCCVKASVDSCQNRQIDGKELADCKNYDVPMIFLEGESMAVSEAKSQVRQFLMTQYLAGPEESMVPAFEDLANINVLADDINHEADSDLNNFSRGTSFDSRPIIPDDCGHIREVNEVVSESVVLLVVPYYHW